MQNTYAGTYLIIRDLFDLELMLSCSILGHEQRQKQQKISTARSLLMHTIYVRT